VPQEGFDLVAIQQDLPADLQNLKPSFLDEARNGLSGDPPNASCFRL
jgi:hypothetical protein